MAVGAVEQTLKLLVQAGTGFHHSQMLLTEGNGTQTIRSRRGSDMAELCTTCPCMLRAPSNIEAFPSAIVKSLKITALGKKKNVPPPPPLHLRGLMDGLVSGASASGRHLLSGSSELSGLLKRPVAMLSRRRHFHSNRAALPFHLSSALWTPRGRPADSFSARGRTRTVFSCGYAALLTEW